MRSQAPLPAAHAHRWFGLMVANSFPYPRVVRRTPRGKEGLCPPCPRADPPGNSPGICTAEEFGQLRVARGFCNLSGCSCRSQCPRRTVQNPSWFGGWEVSTAIGTQPHPAGIPALNPLPRPALPKNTKPQPRCPLASLPVGGQGHGDLSCHLSLRPPDPPTPPWAAPRGARLQPSPLLFIPVYLNAPGRGRHHGTRGR